MGRHDASQQQKRGEFSHLRLCLMTNAAISSGCRRLSDVPSLLGKRSPSRRPETSWIGNWRRLRLGVMMPTVWLPTRYVYFSGTRPFFTAISNLYILVRYHGEAFGRFYLQGLAYRRQK